MQRNKGMSEEQIDIQTPSEKRSETSSYRSIFKATSLFGGVQVYQILISVIKQKFVAVLLGTTGMGIQGLYQSGIDLVKGITSMGLSQSAVRDVSEANGTGDFHRVSRTITILRRLVWFTGLLGLIATICFSPLLSRSLFGDYDYTIPFIILSVILLLEQLCNGQRVLLQGMRRLKHLAKASAYGVTVGLVVSVPLYYWLGIKGIVPTLILNSVTSLLLSWLFARKIPVEKVKVTNRETLHEGRTMLKMGIAMSVTGVLGTMMAYILKAFISNVGGVDDVGLYTAGFVILNTYVGMVFTAISTDYYPRLAAVNKDNDKCKEVINQQGEIAVLIIAPLVMLCIIAMPFLVRLVYSKDFLPASDFILWAIPGVMFRASSTVIAYVFLAKAESKLYVINEVSTLLYGLVLRMAGYYFFGLVGLGIAYFLVYILYTIQVYLIARHKYSFNFSKTFIQVFSVQIIYAAIGFILVHVWFSVWVYVPLVLLLALSTYYSLKELDKRMNLLQFAKQKIKK